MHPTPTTTTPSISETLFNALEQRRVTLNLTQKEVAEQIGVTTRTYKAINDGSAKMATFIDAATALGFCSALSELTSPTTVNPETLFKALEQKRAELHLTQHQVAKQIGVSPRTYKAINSGSAKIATFLDAATALGFSCMLLNSAKSPTQQLKQDPAKSELIVSPGNEENADWHPATIVAAIKVHTGMSLRQLSLINNLAPGTIAQALQRPYPHAQKIIADALNTEARLIWPSRYTDQGKSSRKRLRVAKS